MDADTYIQGLQPLLIPQKNTQTIQIESDYTFQTGDKLYMTIKTQPDNDQTDGDALMAKDWTVGTDAEYDNEGYLALNLAETDTDIDFGDYVYDIKLVNATIKSTIVYGPCQILPVTTLRV
jgi:hypothetical protein